MHSLSTGACPLPLGRARPALPQMTPFGTLMLPTAKHLLARLLTPKIKPLTTLLLLLLLPTLAPVHSPHPARRAGPLVADLRAPVNPTSQYLLTSIITREMLKPTSPDVLHGPTKAPSFYELRAGRAGTRVAKKQAMVAAAVLQRPVADIAARMRQNPRVIARWVLELSTETVIILGDLGMGVLYPTFGAVPD